MWGPPIRWSWKVAKARMTNLVHIQSLHRSSCPTLYNFPWSLIPWRWCGSFHVVTLSLSNYAIMSGQWYYARETGAHSAQLTHNAHFLFPPVSNYSPQIKVIAELSDEGLAGIGRRHTCRNPPKLYYLSIQPFRTIYQKETEITAKFWQTNDWSENHMLLLPQIF